MKTWLVGGAAHWFMREVEKGNVHRKNNTISFYTNASSINWKRIECLSIHIKFLNMVYTLTSRMFLCMFSSIYKVWKQYFLNLAHKCWYTDNRPDDIWNKQSRIQSRYKKEAKNKFDSDNKEPLSCFR